MGIRTTWRGELIWPVALLLAALLPACDTEDDPALPPDPPATGTIVLTVLPDSLMVEWALLGPEQYSAAGAGQVVIEDLLPGLYSINWGEVDGWYQLEPADMTGTLAAGDTLVFVGSFQEIIPPWDTWVTVPAGTFLMGAGAGEDTALRNERPQHQVALTRPFLMQATEVTNAQYLELALWAVQQGMATADEAGLWDNLEGSGALLLDFGDLVGGDLWGEIGYRNGALQLRDVGFGVNPDHPVKMVTWYGAAAYCDWLSLSEGLPRAYDHADWLCGEGDPYGAEGYRLPTEAEWEYACRAGAITPFSSGEITDPFGPFEPALEGVAWYQGNSLDWTHPVAQLEPNAFGLYDMHGNVFKWVNGFEYGYTAEAKVDPVSNMSSGNRVARGGAWTRPSHYHRAAFRRLRETLDYRGPKQGFRPVRTVVASARQR